MKENQPANRSSIWVLPIAWVAAFLPLFLIIYSGLRGTGGIFSYPIDDTFIHLKIAGNLAHNGNWGINPGEFNSASSSLLYTLLLAALIKIFPDPLLLPLIINGIAGTFLIYLLWKWLRKQGLSSIVQFWILLLIIFFTPLPVLMLSGMEHVLQAIFAFLFIVEFIKWSERNFEGKISTALLVTAFFLVASRYEGLFLVAGVCLVLLWKKKLYASILLGFCALLPVIIFGFVSLMKDSYFFPNSVLVKSEAAQFTIGGLIRSWGNILIEKFMFAKAGITLLATQRVLLILPLALIVFRKPLKTSIALKLVLIVLTIAVFLQLALADTGKFYRYEAWLIMLAILFLFTLLFLYGREMWSGAGKMTRMLSLLILAFLFFPLLLRSLAAYSKAGRAMVNIYEQQFQMGRFLNQYYKNDAVAANDIGAISYMRQGSIVDLWGLGTIEVAKSRKGNYWTGEFLDSISREKNARLAIIYDSWIGRAIPPQWEKIATWQIMDNVVCGDDIVSFYAIDPSLSADLRKQLASFQNQLPSTVKVAYYNHE